MRAPSTASISRHSMVQISREETTPRACDVAIIGAGFSGSMLAVHLANSGIPIDIALIERTRLFGPGLAYGSALPEHLLNVPAGKMGAFPDQPGHFLEWVTTHPDIAARFGIASPLPGDFLPRALYGRYLASLVSDAARSCPRLVKHDAEAIDIEPIPSTGYRVTFAHGGSITARDVVLAWGNFPPTAPDSSSGPSRIVHNPWSSAAREALADSGEVLIVGSGLTCMDLLATAEKIGRTAPIHVLSRHGLFPQPHVPASNQPPWQLPPALPKTIRALFRTVREDIGKAATHGTDWRAVIDSLRPVTQEIWKDFTPDERRRFLRHVKSLWETARHRGAPQMRAAKDALDSRHLLIRHKGCLVSITGQTGDLLVTLRPRGSTRVETLRVAHVINAIGPESDPRKIGSPLLDNLLRRGLIRPDPLGLGVEPSWRAHTGPDALHTIGSLRRGALWESTAVPELRVQAREIASHLLASRQQLAMAITTPTNTTSAPATDTGHLWFFEI